MGNWDSRRRGENEEARIKETLVIDEIHQDTNSKSSMSPKQNIHKENQTWAALQAEVGWDVGAEGGRLSPSVTRTSQRAGVKGDLAPVCFSKAVFQEGKASS